MRIEKNVIEYKIIEVVKYTYDDKPSNNNNK
jgi:hypothetical protein